MTDSGGPGNRIGGRGSVHLDPDDPKYKLAAAKPPGEPAAGNPPKQF